MHAKLSKYSTLIILFLLFLNGCKIDDSSEENSLPNVILIISDDQGWGTAGRAVNNLKTSFMG